MRKLTMLAIAVVCSASAFSQDVFKQISKIKDYNEAYNLLKSNLDGMSAEEKAECYNALVDLSLDKVMNEQGTITENQMAEQLKTKVVPYDTVGLYTATMQALENGVACDEFDMQPNEKGKVKPKFHNKNAERLYPIRFHLINAGIYYQGKDEALSYKNLATYVESSEYPLFDEIDKSGDANLTQIAYYAARSAYFAKEFDKAEKYADIALNDTAMAKDAMQIKLAVMQSQLKSHADSLNYVAKLKDMYANDENNEMVFNTMCSMLYSLNDKDGLDAILQDKLAKDPNDYIALYWKGLTYMNDHKWDEAADVLTKVANVQPDNVVIIAYVGQCYMYKAQEADEQATANGNNLTPDAKKTIADIYMQAINYLEKAKDLDKTMESKNYWAYYLYACCYKALGADDPKTKEAELLTK